MFKNLNSNIELPKLRFGKLKLPKLNVKKVKVISGGIVAIDPYSIKTYNYKDNTISNGNINFYDRKNFYISYIYLKDFISGTIEVSRGINDEDLKDAIEIAAYDEFGIDSSIDYLIKYIEITINNSDNRVFNIFAIPYYKIDEIFEDITSIKHIDYITPAPLLHSALYKKDILPRGNVDCFLHFDYDDAYLCIYNDGEFIYSKSLTHSLKKINEEFEKYVAQHIDTKEFFNLLKLQGLKSSDSTVQKNLMKIFGDVFSYANDIIAFAKRSNGIDEIHNIYISSKIGEIKGIEEFCVNYTSIQTKKLDVKSSKNSSEVEIDPLVHMMIVTAKNYKENPDSDNFNISTFQKEPPFFITPTGILTKVTAASILLAALYPTFEYFQKVTYDKKYKNLSVINVQLENKVVKMKEALSSILKEQKSIEKKLEEKNKELGFRTKLLREIYNKKVNYAMKAKILNDLFSKVNKHNSKVAELRNHQREFILTVRSSKDKYITELMKDLSQNKNYQVVTDLIKKDDNKSFYESSIKVSINGSF